MTVSPTGSSTPTSEPTTTLEWWSSRWFRRHAILAPFGVYATTWLLFWSETGHYRWWDKSELASSLVDLGAVLYGMVAMLMEGGTNMVFWALEQREKRRKKLREEMRAEARAEVREEARAEVVEMVLADMRAKSESGDFELSDWADQIEREYGLPSEKK